MVVGKVGIILENSYPMVTPVLFNKVSPGDQYSDLDTQIFDGPV